MTWNPDWQNLEGFRSNFDIENLNGAWNQMVVANGDSQAIYFNGTRVNEASNVVAAEGKIQREVEWAEYEVRRWELWPVTGAAAPTNPL